MKPQSTIRGIETYHRERWIHPAMMPVSPVADYLLAMAAGVIIVCIAMML